VRPRTVKPVLVLGAAGAFAAGCGHASSPPGAVSRPKQVSASSTPTAAIGPCANGISTTPAPLATLTANLGTLPQPPTGATLTGNANYNSEEHGPTVEACYRYTGAAASFVSHYRSVLPAAGWSEAQPGNIPGQLANFEKTVNGERLLLVVFHDGPTFWVDVNG